MREIDELENFMREMLRYADADYKAVMRGSAHSDFEDCYQRFADKYFGANDWLNEYFRRNNIPLPKRLQESLSSKERELTSNANGLREEMKKAFAEWEKVKNLRSKYRLESNPKNDFDYITMQDLFVNNYVNYASKNLTGVMDIFRIIGYTHHAPVHKYYNLRGLNNDKAYRIGYDIGTVAMKLINRLNRGATHSNKQTYAAGVGGGAYETSNAGAPMDQKTAEQTVRREFDKYVNSASDKYYDYTHNIVECTPDIKFKVDTMPHSTEWYGTYMAFDGLKSIIIDGNEIPVDELPTKEDGATAIIDGGSVEYNAKNNCYEFEMDNGQRYQIGFNFSVNDDELRDNDSCRAIIKTNGQRYRLDLSKELATREKNEWEAEWFFKVGKETVDNIMETYCTSSDFHGIPSIAFISSNFIEDNNCSHYYVAFEKGQRVFYTEQDGQYKKMEILGAENCKKVISKDRNEYTSDVLSEDKDCIRYKVNTGGGEDIFDCYIYEYLNDQGEVCFGMDDWDDEHEPYISYTGTHRMFSNDNELLRGLYDIAYTTNTTNSTTTNTNTTTNNTNTNSSTNNSTTTSDTSPIRERKREAQRFDTSDLRQGANRTDEQSRAREERAKEQNDRSDAQAKYEEIKRRRAEERKYSNVSDEEEKRRDAELERARAERAEQEKKYRDEFGMEWDNYENYQSSTHKTHSAEKYVYQDRGMSR